MSALASPVEAKEAGLRYYSDERPGYSRLRVGRGFRYKGPAGEDLDATEVERCKALRVPPAWKHVWISPFANSHLQATGRDERGRKQAIYHGDWRAHRDAKKFDRMRAFGLALPAIRKRIDIDLAEPGLSREKVLAAIVLLLDATLIRIGNRQYARENESFGLTTMLNQHAKVSRTALSFQFRGKSGRFHSISVRNRRLAAVVKRCQDLPGQQLFEYLDEEGDVHGLDSSDVNSYLRVISENDFSAKDFRTWNATVETIRLLRERFHEGVKPSTIVKEVAQRLGNTPAVCRKSYIDPRALIIDPIPAWIEADIPSESQGFLDPVEQLALIHFYPE